MSPNEVRTPPNGVCEVVEVKRRRRLENQLHTLRRIAHLAVEHYSHRLDEAAELHQLRLQLEQVLADEYTRPSSVCAVIGSAAGEVISETLASAVSRETSTSTSAASRAASTS